MYLLLEWNRTLKRERGIRPRAHATPGRDPATSGHVPLAERQDVSEPKTETPGVSGQRPPPTATSRGGRTAGVQPPHRLS